MNTAFTLALGLFVRILLPIGVTLAAIFLLRRLDRNWQKDALALPVVNRGKKRCWEIKSCAPEMRKTCPAAASPETPCWQIFRNKDGVMKDDCLSCDVFRQAPALLRNQSV